MASNSISLVTISTLLPELRNEILLALYHVIVGDFSSLATMWRQCPSSSRAPLRIFLHTFYSYALVSKEVKARVENYSKLWTVIPLGQTDEDNLTIFLSRSLGCPISLIATDGYSIGQLYKVLETDADRVQNLYIDLPADLWPTLSPKIGQVLLPNVRNVFFGARGIRTVEEDEDGAGVGWANAGHAQNVQQNSTSVLAGRHRSQVKSTRAAAQLSRLPAIALIIRDSNFAFQHFEPPYQLVTLHIHKSHNGGTPTLLLNIEDLKRAILSVSTLLELELWDVEAYGPRALAPVIGSNIRYIALRGPHMSIALLTHFLSQCQLKVCVIEFNYSNTYNIILESDILSAASSCVTNRTITSVGIYVNIPTPAAWHSTVDILFKTSENAVFSLQVPYGAASRIHTLLNATVPPGLQLSVEISPGEDLYEVARKVFPSPTELASFVSFHVCVEEHHIPTILSAFDRFRPPRPRAFLWLHGSKRTAAFTHIQVDHRVWFPYVRVADEEECGRLVPRSGGGWVAEDGMALFSPSVPQMHDHLLRMLQYDAA